MAIPIGHKKNFETIKDAFINYRVALLECTDKRTGKPVYVVCGVNPGDSDGSIELVPFTKLFDDNPYDEIDPPK